MANLADLKIDPAVAEYMASRGINLPRCPPRIITPSPGEAPGAWFDEKRVDRFLAACHVLRHTQGKWSGQPLDLDPWQVAYIVAPVFGWVYRNDDGDAVRVVRQVYVDVPRKNGKTTMCGAVALYLMAADGEPGAQVYAAATKKDQAAKLFDPIKQLVENSPALKGTLRPLQGKITHPVSGSYLKVESSDADGIHGANCAGFVLDELHLHKSPDLLKALESGTGSRRQPLGFVITTADDGKTESIYAQRRKMVESLAARTITDQSYYGVVWAATEDDDPFDEATWRIANPGYGISPTVEFLRNEATKAKNSPADFAEFQRLHLGIRTKQVARYLLLADWDRNADTVDLDDLHGRTCFGGLDLAATSDLCSLCLLFPDGEGGYDAKWTLWSPEANLARLDKLTAGMASVWVSNGLITLTPGNVADYDFIAAEIRKTCDSYDVQGINYDPWNSSHLVTQLFAEGVPLVEMRQGYASMSPPLKELQTILKAATDEEPTLRHGGNAAVRWQVDGFPVMMDPAGNVKPDRKAAAANGYKIDAVVSLIMAVDVAMRNAVEDDEFEYDGFAVYS